MRLGIIGWQSRDCFKMAAEKGLEFIEFTVNVGQGVDGFINNVAQTKEWCNEFSVSVGSVGRWGSNRITKDGVDKTELEISYRLIDAASELGCDNFVCGCNYVSELSYYQNVTYAIEYFSALLQYAKAKNVRISTYNCDWNNFVSNDAVWKLIHGHLPELGIKFDPSHSVYAGRDYLKEMCDWGDRFNHVHIKGSLRVDGKRIDDPPAGIDQTNWSAFMGILYAKKYDRGLSIEPHSPVWQGELGAKGIDFTIKMMKSFIL